MDFCPDCHGYESRTCPRHRVLISSCLMLSIQLNQVLRWWSGMIFRRPSRTASAACLPMSVQLTYHCGFNRGSTMSLERLQVSKKKIANTVSARAHNTKCHMKKKKPNKNTHKHTITHKTKIKNSNTKKNTHKVTNQTKHT